MNAFVKVVITMLFVILIIVVLLVISFLITDIVLKHTYDPDKPKKRKP